jgi:competence protein ComEA
MFKLASLLWFLLLATALPAWAGQPVNINTADASAIAAALKGIGQSKAEAIVAYRKEHGPFKSADDLTQVKGIGKKTVENNRELILVDGAAPAAAAGKTEAPSAGAPAHPGG